MRSATVVQSPILGAAFGFFLLWIFNIVNINTPVFSTPGSNLQSTTTTAKMPYTLYDVLIPQIAGSLDALESVLKSAEASGNAPNFDAKLVDDMLPLSFQLFQVTAIPRQVAARAASATLPQIDKNVDSFAEAYKRIDEGKAALATIDKDTFNSKADEVQQIGFGPGVNIDMKFKTYVTGFAIPNLSFHLVSAYSILRKSGVPLGKKTFLTPFLKDVQLPF